MSASNTPQKQSMDQAQTMSPAAGQQPPRRQRRQRRVSVRYSQDLTTSPTPEHPAGTQGVSQMVDLGNENSSNSSEDLTQSRMGPLAEVLSDYGDAQVSAPMKKNAGRRQLTQVSRNANGHDQDRSKPHLETPAIIERRPYTSWPYWCTIPSPVERHHPYATPTKKQHTSPSKIQKNYAKVGTTPHSRHRTSPRTSEAADSEDLGSSPFRRIDSPIRLSLSGPTRKSLETARRWAEINGCTSKQYTTTMLKACKEIDSLLAQNKQLVIKKYRH